MLQVIIPAAGLGTRMLPYSGITAKELAPLGTKPVLQITLEEAFSLGIKDVTVVISPRKVELERFLNADFPESVRSNPAVSGWIDLLSRMNVTIAYQKEPKGLGDAFLHGRKAAPADYYYLMYPDNLVTDPARVYHAMMHAFDSSGNCIVSTMKDQSYWSGNHFIYPGEVSDGVFYAKKATRRDDPAPAEGEEHYRACGRVLVTDEYMEILEDIRAKGIDEELDDIHAYQELIRRGKLFCSKPTCDIHDGGDLVGYKNAWKAYLNSEFRLLQ